MSEMRMEQRPHWFAKWFSNRMPIFVPDVVMERRIRRWTERTDQRRSRRFLAAAIVFIFAFLVVLWAGEAWFEHVHPGSDMGLLTESWCSLRELR